MSDTPTLINFARQLERELAEAKRELEKWEKADANDDTPQYIAQLEQFNNKTEKELTLWQQMAEELAKDLNNVTKFSLVPDSLTRFGALKEGKE